MSNANNTNYRTLPISNKAKSSICALLKRSAYTIKNKYGSVIGEDHTYNCEVKFGLIINDLYCGYVEYERIFADRREETKLCKYLRIEHSYTVDGVKYNNTDIIILDAGQKRKTIERMYALNAPQIIIDNAKFNLRAIVKTLHHLNSK